MCTQYYCQAILPCHSIYVHKSLPCKSSGFFKINMGKLFFIVRSIYPRQPNILFRNANPCTQFLAVGTFSSYLAISFRFLKP